MEHCSGNIEKILVSPEEIEKRVRELGQEITEAYQGKKLVIACILRGSLVFTADLIRHIDRPLILDTMVISSYGASAKSSGVVKINKDLETDIDGKHVLIVEDIVDTGLTINYLMKLLGARNPASVKVCSFLDKPSRREMEATIDFTGFVIPDEFVIGYGLDFIQEYRNYPAVAVLKPDVY